MDGCMGGVCGGRGGTGRDGAHSYDMVNHPLVLLGRWEPVSRSFGCWPSFQVTSQGSVGVPSRRLTKPLYGAAIHSLDGTPPKKSQPNRQKDKSRGGGIYGPALSHIHTYIHTYKQTLYLNSVFHSTYNQLLLLLLLLNQVKLLFLLLAVCLF